MHTIIFDVGNVIIKADQNITIKILSDHNISEEKAKKFFNNKEYAEFSRGNISNEEFYNALINKYLQCTLSYEQIVNAHNSHLYEVDKEVVQILSKLSSKNLIIMTDTNTWQTERENELINLSEYSKQIFRSHEIHMLKIDKDCFPHIIHKLNCNPDQLLLIDNSPEKIRAAQKNGLQTIKFIDSKQLIQALKELDII